MKQVISERTFFGQAECSHHVSTSSLYDISSLWATGNSEVHRRPLFNFHTCGLNFTPHVFAGRWRMSHGLLTVPFQAVVT